MEINLSDYTYGEIQTGIKGLLDKLKRGRRSG